MAVSKIKADKIDFVVNASSNILSVTRQGLNAIRIDQGTALGSYTASNNLRGVVARQDTVCVGFITSYNGAEAYTIGNNGTDTWMLAKKLTAS